MNPLTLRELAELGPATITVPEAGALLGIGRDAAYAAAERGQIPTLRLGRNLRVPVPRLLELLGLPTATPENAEAGATTAPGLATVHVLTKELESSDGAPHSAP
jgi:excisionase family DNA binding protein